MPTSNNAALQFSSMARDIPAERRSAKKVDRVDDYDVDGHVPPGIYGASYWRFDLSHGGRHRIALSDEPCLIDTATCSNAVRVHTRGRVVNRSGLQFHPPYVDQFSDDISHGCVTIKKDNWQKVFPGSFTEPSTSPLRSNVAAFMGLGRVAIFVTDITDPARRTAQKTFFAALLAGKLTDRHFRSRTPERTQLLVDWKLANAT